MFFFSILKILNPKIDKINNKKLAFCTSNPKEIPKSVEK
jgi:hypothetical protein